MVTKINMLWQFIPAQIQIQIQMIVLLITAPKIEQNNHNKGLGAIKAKIGPTSEVDKTQNVFTICAFQK